MVVHDRREGDVPVLGSSALSARARVAPAAWPTSVLNAPMLGAPAPTSYYAHVGVDMLWTGDLAVTEDMHLPPVRPDDETGNLEPQEDDDAKRGFERYDLTQNFVRASVLPRNDAAGHSGRVTSASVTGMWVETEHPLAFRSDVDVDWCVMGSFSLRFAGRVVRTSATGMAVVLDVDDSSWRFRSSFIDLARTPSDEPPSVIVQPRSERAPAIHKTDGAILRLAEHWTSIEDRLDDDAAHQAFISACLAAQRLEYALERYRELKLHNPNSVVATRYLKQIGTILTFYTFKRQAPESGTPTWKKGAALIVLLIVGAVGSLTLAERLTQSQITSKQTITRTTPNFGAPR